MIVVRPVEAGDLDALERLAMMSGIGMTNLPSERALLEGKIAVSLESFARVFEPHDSPGEESYLLVGEETASGAVVGCTGVIAGVGLSRPFYSYKLINLPHTSQELERYGTYAALQMVDEYRGAAEIGTLYLEPDQRRDGNGRLLSRCRFLLLADFQERFPGVVMAEMRGVQDERGRSVFWESLGRHFFDMDFSSADYLSALGKHQFIADLMPKHPVYVCLLPKAAQTVVGVAHEESRPAQAMLEREGFRFEGCVDVFDGGPTLHCPVGEVRTVRESATGVVVGTEPVAGGETWMVSNRRLDGLRIARGAARVEGPGAITLETGLAAALAVGADDEIRYVRF